MEAREQEAITIIGDTLNVDERMAARTLRKLHKLGYHLVDPKQELKIRRDEQLLLHSKLGSLIEFIDYSPKGYKEFRRKVEKLYKELEDSLAHTQAEAHLQYKELCIYQVPLQSNSVGTKRG